MRAHPQCHSRGAAVAIRVYASASATDVSPENCGTWSRCGTSSDRSGRAEEGAGDDRSGRAEEGGAAALAAARASETTLRRWLQVLVEKDSSTPTTARPARRCSSCADDASAPSARSSADCASYRTCARSRGCRGSARIEACQLALALQRACCLPSGQLELAARRAPPQLHQRCPLRSETNWPRVERRHATRLHQQQCTMPRHASTLLRRVRNSLQHRRH